jgi:hypothetical protein
MSDATFELVDAKDRFIDSDWFQHCRQTRTPFIVVRTGEHSADVLWDFVTLPPECDAELRTNLAALERDAQAIFERYAIPESHLRVKPTLIGFDRLPFDRAKLAAAELYALIATYLPVSVNSAATSSRAASIQPGAPGIGTAATQENPRALWVETVSTSTAA